MFLSWHGHTCFSLSGKQVSFAFDPYDESEIGLKLPDLSVDVITFSFYQEGLKSTDSVKVFDWPGEFEVAGIPFIGISSFHPETGKETLIFKFTIDNVNICHLGLIDHVPTSEVIDKIGKIDLLMAPVGGYGDFTTKQVTEILEDMEPSIFVPMAFAIPGSKPNLPELQGVLKGLGAKEHRVEDRLDLKKTSYPAGHMEVVELKPILGK
jgi:L-ascorbate metabolism protein UlaG (beta-lactamase superfamily)